MSFWLLQSNPPKLSERVTAPMAYALLHPQIPFRDFQVVPVANDAAADHYRVLFDDDFVVPAESFFYGSVRELEKLAHS